MFRWFFPALLSGLIALIAFLPLGWAASWFAPDEIDQLAPDLKYGGTIWDGSLSGLPLFGDANFKISPLSRAAKLQSGNGQNYLIAAVQPGVAKDVVLKVDVATIPFTDGRLQGLRGEANMKISELKFEGQSCLSAEGTVQTDVLRRNGGTANWVGPDMSGPIRCEDGVIIADMMGNDAEQNIQALIRLSPDNTYRADITVRTSRVEANAILPLFGFSRSGQNFVLTEQGRWR